MAVEVEVAVVVAVAAVACGLPTRAIPSSTEIARMTSAKYGGMRNGNSNVISARSAASSWKLMLLAPPPASAASKTRASAGMSGAVSVSFGMKSREMKSSPMLRGEGWAVR